ncbi:cytochrome P450 [Aspergillus californicus]
MQSRHLCEVTDCILYDGLLPRLDAVVAGCDDGRIDGLDLSYRVCADYLSSFLFGHCNGTTFLSLSSETKSRSDQRDTLERWRFHYENLSCHEAFFVQEMPGLYKFLKTVGINLLPRRYVEATAFLESWMSAMADKAERAITWKRSTGLALPPKDEPVVYETARAAVTEDSPHLSEQEQRMQIASEMFDHVCLVLGYAFWYLAQHPGAQHRIHTELQEHGIDMSSPSVYGQDTISPSRAVQLDSLPYLCAVINECLRMRPTSTPLPRITPPDREVSVAGVDGIPPNTRINSFQWFMHRDPRKWERVDAWDPERWLSRDGSDGRKHDGEDVLWPFASGPRMCLGNHWAYYCMQHVLAAACSRFVFTALPREERECWPGSPEDELPVRVALRID